MIQPTQPAAAARFVEEHLSAHPDATYDEVRRAASAAGLTIYPNMFGDIRKRVRARRIRPNAPEVEPVVDERRFGSRWPDADVRPNGAGIPGDREALLGARGLDALGAAPEPQASQPAARAPARPPGRPSGVFEPLPTQARATRSPMAAAPSGPAAALEDFVARVRSIEAQTLRYQGALMGIRTLIGEALAELDEE